MNTFISYVSGNSFRKAIASLALTVAIVTGQAATAQSISVADNESALEQTTNTFQAFVHPLQNSLSVKVHFVNPTKETINMAIYDKANTLVYKKTIGKDAVFHRKFDLASLPDGQYTVVINSRKDSYSRSILIQTQQERFALAK